ncbi:MAG: hypothetical protein K6F85_05590 [Bacteroidales bacterium]|nr:hypothetical protein [Bacteroidales bacterium]
MIFCKNSYRNLILGLIATLVFASCKNTDEVAVPSFLHVDAISVAKPADGPFASESDGFFTSDINAAYVVAYYPGHSAVDTIGGFQLPFTVPIRYTGQAEYIEIYPMIKISGTSGMRGFYPFYSMIVLRDSLMFNELDTLKFDTLKAYYAATMDAPLKKEFFEPTQGGIIFDSVVNWIRHDASAACTGFGCGNVHINADQNHVDFKMTEKCTGLDPNIVGSKTVYLELDYRGNKRLSVEMTSARERGGNETTEEIMTINPSDTWKKIYITLGRTWKWFNYNPEFRIVFSVLNAEGTEGDIWIDNVKIISTSAS